MNAKLLTFSLLLPAVAWAEPPLAEFAGGAIPDDARAALREAFYEEVTLLGDPALAPRPSGIAKLKMDELVQKYPQLTSPVAMQARPG